MAYTKVARLLLADGYTIDKSDKQLGYIVTGPRSTAVSRGIEVSLRFVVSPGTKGATIEEMGDAYSSIIGKFPIDYTSAAASPDGRSWAEMMRVASLYADATLSYKRKP